jgi:ribosomal protein L11 methylase PrmA
LALLEQLRRWIGRLEPVDTGKTAWGDYASTHTYSDAEMAVKQAFVSEFVARIQPRILIDMGCNTGDYSAVALDAGAEYVVGFDFDHGALECAFNRSVQKRCNFLPLWLDAANPSPDQGWHQAERIGLARRARADGLIALAFVHHLAIGRNVPLPQVIDWITSLAPLGVIEFVPKDDKMVKTMLALREDIFDQYCEERFIYCLSLRARIVRSEQVSKSGRKLFWYETAPDGTALTRSLI